MVRLKDSVSCSVSESLEVKRELNEHVANLAEVTLKWTGRAAELAKLVCRYEAVHRHRQTDRQSACSCAAMQPLLNAMCAIAK